MVGHDLDERDRSATDLSRDERHFGQVAEADPRQMDSRDQAASGLDTAIDGPAASLDRTDGDPKLFGALCERFGELETAAIQR
jgi:hypothetical protein